MFVHSNNAFCTGGIGKHIVTFSLAHIQWIQTLLIKIHSEVGHIKHVKHVSWGGPHVRPHWHLRDSLFSSLFFTLFLV